MKAKVSVTIDREVLAKSHALGVNVSKVCENYLKEIIHALENLNNQNTPFLGKASFGKEGLVRLPGFEPGSSTWQTLREIDWTGFRESLEAKQYRGFYAQQMFNYAFQFGDCLLTGDFSKIKQLPQTKTHGVLSGVSALAKFLGCYDDFRRLLKKHGLSWVGRSADDLIIDRLNRSDDPEEIWQWIRDVKMGKPEFSSFMDLLSITGLRLSEAIHSYNFIIQFSREKTLTEKYYNAKTGFLEHFRFREVFVRSTKKAYISFVPPELLEIIGAQVPIPRPYAIQKNLARHHIPQRFSDVREANGTFLVKYLKEIEIDVFQGRISGTVFKTHYLNVKLIADLRKRAAKAAAEILKKVAIDVDAGQTSNLGVKEY